MVADTLVAHILVSHTWTAHILAARTSSIRTLVFHTEAFHIRICCTVACVVVGTAAGIMVTCVIVCTCSPSMPLPLASGTGSCYTLAVSSSRPLAQSSADISLLCSLHAASLCDVTV